MASKKKGGGSKTKLLATLVGAAAAGYYLYGSKGAENRKKVKAWTLKAKGEVLEKFENTKEVTDESYEAAVDAVTKRYANMKTVGAEEAGKLNRELKRHWRAIKSAAQEKERPKRATKKTLAKKSAGAKKK